MYLRRLFISQLSLRSLVLATFLLSTVSATAATVTAHKKCTVIISGLTEIKKGDTVTITGKDGAEHQAVIGKIVKKKAIGTLKQVEGKCPSGLKGATVSSGEGKEGETNGRASAEPASTATPTSGIDSKRKRFTIRVEGGYLMTSAGLGVEDSASDSVDLKGLSYGGSFAFNVPVGSKMQIPLSLGIAATSQSAEVIYGGNSYDFVLTHMAVRAGAGFVYWLGSLGFLAEGFFDYGFGSKVKYKEEDSSTSLLGGGNLGLQYAMGPVTLGLVGTFSAGQFTLTTKNVKEEGTASITGFGGGAFAGFSF